MSFHIIAYAQSDSLKIFRNHGSDYTQTIYPKNDSLTYNQYVGETIAGFTLADGWRRDTINGGFNKEFYDSPYVSSLRLEKKTRKRNGNL